MVVMVAEERQIEQAKCAYVDGAISLERFEELIGWRLRGWNIAQYLAAIRVPR